jgi:hypothetical protein
MAVQCPIRKKRVRDQVYSQCVERLESAKIFAKYGTPKRKEDFYEVGAKGMNSLVGRDEDGVHFIAHADNLETMNAVGNLYDEISPILKSSWKDQHRFQLGFQIQVNLDYPIPADRLKPRAGIAEKFKELNAQALAFTCVLDASKYSAVVRAGSKRRSAVLLIESKESKEYPSTIPKDLSRQFMSAADTIGRYFGEV